MLSDVLVTMGANVVEDPEPRMTGNGTMWTRLRLAATPRRYDKGSDAWVDGETVWLDAVCWRRLAEHVVDSLRKGDRVVVHGRLRRRAYEVDGQKRHAFEVEAESVAPDLSRGVATVRRAQRSGAAAAVTAAPVTPAPEGGTEPAAPAGGPGFVSTADATADPWATPVSVAAA